MNNNIGLALLGFGIFLGLSIGLGEFGEQIKYGLTRQACLTQGMSALECAIWNQTWEKLS